MPILGFRHEDSRDFLLCQPITPRWHISSFGTKSLSSTLAPRYQSLLLPHYLRRYFICGALAEASSSGELEKATQASKQEATEVSKTEEANSSHNPRSTLNETKRHRRKVKTKSQSFKVKKGEIVESWETSGVKGTEWLKEFSLLTEWM